jgi:predicted RNase H-like HicB family nuclease
MTRQPGTRMPVEYLVVIEKSADGSFSAYVPDVPGCVSCGDSIEDAKVMIQEAICVHIDSLQKHKEPVPKPAALACFVHCRSVTFASEMFQDTVKTCVA